MSKNSAIAKLKEWLASDDFWSQSLVDAQHVHLGRARELAAEIDDELVVKYNEGLQAGLVFADERVEAHQSKLRTAEAELESERKFAQEIVAGDERVIKKLTDQLTKAEAERDEQKAGLTSLALALCPPSEAFQQPPVLSLVDRVDELRAERDEVRGQCLDLRDSISGSSLSVEDSVRQAFKKQQLVGKQEKELTTLRQQLAEKEKQTTAYDCLRTAVDSFLHDKYDPERRDMRTLNCAYEQWRDAQPPTKKES